PLLYGSFAVHETAPSLAFFLFFSAPATPEIYTLSLHDALPISYVPCPPAKPTSFSNSAAPPTGCAAPMSCTSSCSNTSLQSPIRSEEHTSELQSRENLVCRLLLEKKKNK